MREKCINKRMRLSKNFTLSELTKSSTATRLAIDNTPTTADIDNLTDLTQNVLQHVRDRFGKVVVTSGFRCFQLNHAIGGSNFSQHIIGAAADFTVPGRTLIDVATWIRDHLTFDQLILEFDSWLHVSYDRNHNRNDVLTATKVNGATSYQKGLIE